MKFAEIGARIRALRLEKGLKQEDVAAALHTSRVNYTKMETGERDLKTEHCVALAQFFGVSCDYILTGMEFEQKDIPEVLGLEPAVIRYLAAANKQRTSWIKTMQDLVNINMVDVVNGLLRQHEYLEDTLKLMYQFFYIDFLQPNRAESETPGTFPILRYLINDPCASGGNGNILYTDGHLFEEAYLNLITRELGKEKQAYDVKRREANAQEDHP